MRVVLAGGRKTDNITNAVRPKFEDSGEEVISIKSIEQLTEYINCGYDIDRLIITEQCISDDWAISEEKAFRERVALISSVIADKLSDVTVLFLTQYDDLANLIYEESLQVRYNSRVIVKEPKYSVAFFINLIQSEIESLPEDIVFEPEDAEVQPSEDGIVEERDEERLHDGTDDEEVQEKSEYDALEEFKVMELTEEAVSDKKSIGEFDDDFGLDDIEGAEDIECNLQGMEFRDNFEGDFEDKLEDGFDDDFDGNFEEDIDDSFESEFTDGLEDELESNFESSESNKIEDKINDYEEITNEEENTSEVIDNIYNEESNQIYDECRSNYDIKDTVGVYEEDTGESIYHQEEEEVKWREANVEVSTLIDIDEGTGRKGIFSKAKKGKTYVSRNMGLRDMLEPFASRGTSIVVTGCGGCGTSTTAMNIANTITSLGYNVLLVDLDTKYKTQGYMTKQAYASIDVGSMPLVSAINSSAPAEAHSKIVKPGLHILSIHMASDSVYPEDVIRKEKISRFGTVVKSSYDFIIYDIPFDYATTFFSDITMTADNILLNIDSSNWGISKTLISMCNIESEDMQDTLFNRAQVLFNRYRDLSKCFGQRTRGIEDVLRCMDDKVVELLGEDIGMYFRDLYVVGRIAFREDMEEGWFSSVQLSDTEEGRKLYLSVISKLILRR